MPVRERVVGIIGLGRVGSTLGLALHAVDVPIVVWDRRPAVRRAARRFLGKESVVSRVEGVWARGDVLLIALPDGVLSSVAPVPSPRRVVAHLSGLRPASVLERLARAGHATASVHPLRSFPRRWLHAPLGGTVFAIEGGRDAVPALRRLARRLGGIPVVIAAAHKPLYHAAAALAANHGLFLAHIAERWMGRAGVPTPLARRGLAALMASAVASYAARGLPGGLTGPLRRGDGDAVRAHRRAAAWDARGFRIYAETARQALGPGGILSALPAADRKRLLAALGSPEHPRASRRRGGGGPPVHPPGAPETRRKGKV